MGFWSTRSTTRNTSGARKPRAGFSMPDLQETAPRPLETRWPCPVCVGVLMEKKHVDGPGRGFTIDFCPRCGGIWFDRGEVAEVARRDRSALAGLLREAGARVNPPCHKC